MRSRLVSVFNFCSICYPGNGIHLGTFGRVATADGSRGFQPTDPERHQTLRRGATPEGLQSSLRDERSMTCLRPWVETHGYHHGVATRRVAAF